MKDCITHTMPYQKLTGNCPYLPYLYEYFTVLSLNNSFQFFPHLHTPCFTVKNILIALGHILCYFLTKTSQCGDEWRTDIGKLWTHLTVMQRAGIWNTSVSQLG